MLIQLERVDEGLNSNFVCPRTLANGAHELPIGHDVNVTPVTNFAGEILGPWGDGCWGVSATQHRLERRKPIIQ